MIAFAVTEGGLTLDEFERLSWFEWSLLILKVKSERERGWMYTREVVAAIYNVNRDQKKRPKPFEGKEFYPLSFDNKDEEKKVMTPKEIKEMFGSKFKHDG